MIAISIGHHPYAKGASYEKRNEYDIAKVWASHLTNMLGDKAMLVPTGTLKEKVMFINNMDNVNVAVEIHFNSAVNSDGENIGKGSETLYYPHSKEGRQLAETLQESLSRVFPPNRGAKEGWYQMNKSKGADYFLSRTKCVAVIVEPDFIHRYELIDENMKSGCAAIANALLEFIE